MMLMAFLAAATLAQGYDADGRLWRSLAGDVSARCLIEVAAATGEQHLLTQETYRIAAERKAVQLAGAARQMARTTDASIASHDRLMARQRDLFDNGLITRSEYEAAAAQAPDLQFLIHILQAYPACDFLRAEGGPSVRRARDTVARRGSAR